MIEAACSSDIYATRSNFNRLHPPYVRINTKITRRFGSTADTFRCRPRGIVLCALHGHNAHPPAQPQQQRIFAVSDIHTDAYKENLRWCRRLDPQEFSKDVLLVAGDVSDDFVTLEKTLSILIDRFGAVFYCPGNHEVWIRSFDRENGIATSWDKLRKVFDLCARLGVRTTPQRLHNTWVCPIMSWHHRNFDEEPDVPGVPGAGLMTIADYAACDWSLPFTRQNARGLDTSLEEDPTVDGNGQVDMHQEHQKMRWNGVSDDVACPGSLELAEWWDELNDGPIWDAFLTDITTNSRDVITFSHFAPYQHCLPEKRFLFYANLAKAAGSVPLGRRVKTVKPAVHVFGHSHFAWDLTVDGTRFIQAPLCSPSERSRRLRTIAFDAFGEEASARPVEANWLPLEIYRFNPDTPEISFGSDNAVHTTAKHQTHNQPLEGTPPTPTATPASSNGQVARHGDPKMHSSSVVTDENSTVVGNRRCGDHADDLTACNEAVHGASARLCDDPLPLKNHLSIQSLPSTPSSGPLSQQIEQHSGVGERGSEPRVQLLHGSCPGPLGAHWSIYYENTARTPEDVTMAPWVARAYRHRKRKKKDGRSDATSSTSNSN